MGEGPRLGGPVCLSSASLSAHAGGRCCGSVLQAALSTQQLFPSNTARVPFHDKDGQASGTCPCSRDRSVGCPGGSRVQVALWFTVMPPRCIG